MATEVLRHSEGHVNAKRVLTGGEQSIEAMLALATYQRAGGATAQVSEHVQQILGQAPRSVRDFARDYGAQFKGN